LGLIKKSGQAASANFRFVLTSDETEIYVDTSIIGGFFDDEFKEATQRLFKRLEKDEVRFVISDLLELELIQAPKHVSELLLKYPGDRFERIELTQETME